MTERDDTTLSTADLARRGDAQNVDPPDLDVALTDAANRTTSGTAETSDTRYERSPLLRESDAAELRDRWQHIQTGFVDEPRRAVEEADALVAQLMQRLADMFADERSQLESQWDRGDDVSTEDLRIALQRYRSFFDRLLTA